MRNGNVALGLGVLVIGLLAVSGTLQRIWSAIMSSGTQGTQGSGTSGGSGTSTTPGGYSPVGTAHVDIGAILSPGGSGNPVGPKTGSVLDPAVGKTPGAQNTTIWAGQNPALDELFAKLPTGSQAVWDVFYACVLAGGSIDVCRAQHPIPQTGGRG